MSLELDKGKGSFGASVPSAFIRRNMVIIFDAVEPHYEDHMTGPMIQVVLNSD